MGRRVVRHYDRNVVSRSSAVTRFGPWPWVAVDAIVAAGWFAVLVAAYTEAALHHHPGEWRLPLLYLLAPLATLPMAVRRRWPLQAFAVVLAGTLGTVALGIKETTITVATFVLFTVAVQESRRWSLLALAATEAEVVVSFVLVSKGDDLLNAAFAALVQLTVWVVGYAVGRHRADLARLQQQSLRRALAEQRLEMARELHDVVAHAMSVVAVQAGVGSHLIATRPDQAAKSLSAIEATARAALSETRSLLGVMRDSAQDPAGLTPPPGIGSVSGLVRQLTDAGQPVSLRVEGQQRTLPPTLELSAYRVVQEALTNVVRHAGRSAAAEVVICYDDQGVQVTVTDDGAGQAAARHSPHPGHGLTGMRERVSLLGGDLRAGPRSEGGYQVMARLPAVAGGR
jgi:signal transduction histidine kinase